MADEEMEAGEGGKKSSILTYILIGVGVVDGRRHDPVLEGQHASHRLDAAGSTEQVTSH